MPTSTISALGVDRRSPGRTIDLSRGSDPDGNNKRRERGVWLKQEQVVFDGFFRLKEATLRYERFDGKPSEPLRRLKLDRGDSVAALICNTDTGRVLLVEQFKYPTYGKGDGWILETVAGMVDGGELRVGDPPGGLRGDRLRVAHAAAHRNVLRQPWWLVGADRSVLW
jgi:hypothetical protein